MDLKCYVLGKGCSEGMLDMTSSLLKSIHFLTLGQGDGFQRWGSSCSSPGDDGRNWGSLEGGPRTSVSSRQTSPPLLARLGIEREPDHLRSSSRIVRRCAATEPALPRPRWDIWSCSGCHLFLRRDRSRKKAGSVICPFVGCISCSASCDVTD